MLVERGDAGSRVDDEEHDIGIGDGTIGLPPHARGQAVVHHLLEPGRVDDAEIEIGEPRLPFAPVARHPRRVVDQGEPLPDQPVEQRRLADIGPTDDGGGEGHSAQPIPVRAIAWR